MNRIHNIVWNAHRGAWVVAAECVRSQSKQKSAARLAAAVTVLLAGHAAAADPTATAASGSTRSYTAANGVTVVDIAAANGAGLSHNLYTQYNVDSKGLVLNNGNDSQLSRLSQLAGQVAANLNLKQEAKVILNEVVSPNRSILAGFTEVLGSKADVVVANPYGITCSGCGFINTDRVTLSTGSSLINPDGSLAGFNVRQGDILITGSGLNASDQQILDLVTRSIRIEAPVNGQDVTVTAGAVRWGYAQRGVEAVLGGDGAAPGYAIDSSALGGMYANRIRMIATEAGVGVRMRGDAAATVSDFSLTAAGTVELAGKLSANTTLAVDTRGDLALAAASLAARQDIALTADGAASLSGGALVADGNLVLRAASLADSAGSATLDNDNLRYAGTGLSLTVTGQAGLDGTRWGAGGNWTGSLGALTVGSRGATLYAGQGLTLDGSGDLALGTAALRSQGDLALQAGGLLSTAAGTGQGLQSVAGKLSLTAAVLDNGGTATADAGTLILRAGQVGNSGTLHGAAGVDIADRDGMGAEAVQNSGRILSEGRLALKAASLGNSGSGWIQAALGSLAQLGSLSNDGTWLLSTAAGSGDRLDVGGAIDNRGLVQSAQALAVNAVRVGNDGKLLAAGDLAVTASGSGGYRNGAGAVTQSGGTLTLDVLGDGVTNAAGGLFKAAAIQLTSLGSLANDGTLSADTANLGLRVGGLANSGTLYGKTALALGDRSGGSSEAVQNSGTILSDGDLALLAAGFGNTATGWIQARGSAIQVASLDNAGTWLLSTQSGGDDSLQVGGHLGNSGSLQSARGLTVSAADVDNQGKLLAQGALRIDTAASGGYVNGGQAATQSGDLLTLNAGSGGLDNRGLIKAANVTVTTPGDISNSGSLVSAGTLGLNARQLDILTNGWIQAAAGSQVRLAGLSNAGVWLLSTAAGGRDSLTLSGALNNSGVLQSAQGLDLAAASADNSGKLVAAADLALQLSGNYTGRSGAIVQSGGLLDLSADSVDNLSGATLKAAQLSLGANRLGNAGTASAESGAARLRVGALDNSGTLHGGSGIDIADTGGNGGEAVNNSGLMITEGDLVLAATTVSNSAAGWIQAASGSRIGAGRLDNQGTLILSTRGDGSDSLQLAADLQNSGTLRSGGRLDLGAATVGNSGSLTADGTLAIVASGAAGIDGQGRASGGVVNSGLIYSGQTLDISGSNLGLLNQAGARLLGDRLDIDVARLDNSGTLQGGTAGDSVLRASLVNNAAGAVLTLATSAAGGGSVVADQLNNDGTLQSQGRLALALSTQAVNNGKLLAGGDLQVRGSSSDRLLLKNYGTLQAGGLLDLAGLDGSNNFALTLGASSLTLGGTVNIVSFGLGLADGARLSSVGDLKLTSDNLVSSGTASRILAVTGGSGTADIRINNSVTNNGLIYSFADLKFSAVSITNAATAAFGAAGALSLSSDSNLNNHGALWSGGTMTLAVANLFKNFGSTSAAEGTVDADGDIVLTAAMVINNSTINGKGSITINAGSIRNEVAGGDTRVWGDYTGKTTTLIDTAPKDYRNTPGHAGDQDQWWTYTDVWSRSQYYSGGRPSFTPQITATRNLNMGGFTSATNLGAILSADVINLSGAGGATFTNDDLSLKKETLTDTYKHYILWSAIGPAKYIDDDHYDSHVVTVTSYIDSLGAGIFAHAINGNNFSLSNNGAVKTVTTTARNGEAVNGTGLADSSDGDSGPGAKSYGGTAGTGTQGASNSGGANGSGAIGYGGSAGSSGVAGLSFGGLNLSLPSNPNGYYVVISTPGAKYLVETNPLFTSASSAYAGSAYLAAQLGLDPDTLNKRLGDGNYEAYLVKQEVIAQTGRALLSGTGSDTDQMQKLMNQAATAGKSLGLVYGKAPTTEQLARLDTDIVWMVETEVQGQKVLAPVVYLSQKTRDSIEKGAVIAADTVNLQLTSLTNTGGTISGAQSLNIVSNGDIANLSGTLKGGDVSLSSTTGSIVNKTYSEGSGDDKVYVTTLGKTAGIESTGNLSLTAAKDITNLGAQVKAGGDASLNAGGNVTFDTIQQRTVTTTETHSEGGGVTSQSSTTVDKVTQVGSGLSVGGNLSASSGKDITLAGTNVQVGGDASLKATGDLNILSRTDTTKTVSTSRESGLGVGGGVFGISTTSSEREQGSSVASQIDIKGNATLDAGKDITLKGSNLVVGGDGKLTATNVNVLAGENYDLSKKTTETTTFFKISGAESSSETVAKAAAESTKDKTSGSVSASAEASASGSAAVDLALMSNTRSTTETTSIRNAGSSISFGGSGSINAAQAANIAGSAVKAEGDLNVSAATLNVTAAKNVETSRTSTTETKIGLMVSAGGQAGASAEAAASGDRKSGLDGSGSASAAVAANANGDASATLFRVTDVQSESRDVTHTASALSGANVTLSASQSATIAGSTVAADKDLTVNAASLSVVAVQDESTRSTKTTRVDVGLTLSSANQAKGEAGVDAGSLTNASASIEGKAGSGNTLTLLQAKTASEGSLDSTAKGSSLSSGGDMKIDAGKSLQVTGSSLAAGGNAEVKADTQTFSAAEDRHETSSSSNTTRLGIYADAEAGAGAKGQIMASADASAEAGAGFFANNTGNTSIQGKTQAVVSSITSGGNLTRTAKESISDTGTAIDVGGNLTQSAKTITSKAASDGEYSVTSSQTTEGRYGVYAGASAGASVAGASADADASIGARVSLSHENETTTTRNTTAVVSNIKVGGNVNSTSSGGTTLEGTNIEAGGNVNLGAGDLQYTAARNTSSTQTTSGQGAAVLTVNVNAESVVGGQLSVSGGGSSSQTTGSEAVVGGIKAGGNVNLGSAGNARFEGTRIESGGDTRVAAGGNVDFAAAASTSSSSSNGASASLNIGAAAGGNAENKTNSSMFSVDASYAQSSSTATTREAAQVNSGGKIEISSGGNTRLEGTQLGSGGDTVVAAKGDLTVEAARDTSSGNSFGVGVTLGASAGTSSKAGETTKEKSATGGLSGNYSQENSDVANAASIQSGGSVRLSSGRDTVLEGTAIEAADSASVRAGGTVTQKEAKSSSESFGLAAGLTLTAKSKSSSYDPKGTGGAGTPAGSGKDVVDDGLGSASNVAQRTGDSAKGVTDAKNARQVQTDGLGSASTLAQSSGKGAKSTDGSAQIQDDGLGSASQALKSVGGASKTADASKANGTVVDDGLGSASGTVKAVGTGAGNKAASKRPDVDDASGSFSVYSDKSSQGVSIKGGADGKAVVIESGVKAP